MRLVESRITAVFPEEGQRYRELVYDATNDRGYAQTTFRLLREPRSNTPRKAMIGTFATIWSKDLPVPSSDPTTKYDKVRILYVNPDGLIQTAVVGPNNGRGDSWEAKSYSERQINNSGDETRSMRFRRNGEPYFLEHRSYDPDAVLNVATSLVEHLDRKGYRNDATAAVVTRVERPMDYSSLPVFARAEYGASNLSLNNQHNRGIQSTDEATIVYDPETIVLLPIGQKITVAHTDQHGNIIGTDPDAVYVNSPEYGGIAVLDISDSLRMNGIESANNLDGSPTTDNADVSQTIDGRSLIVGSKRYGQFVVPSRIWFDSLWEEMLF